MIIKLSELSQLRSSLSNKKIVLAGGTFDLLHQGHIEFFKSLRKFGDIVIIAVSADKRVKQKKGSKRPILSEKVRLIIVDSIRYIDYSFIAPSPQKDKPVPSMRVLTLLKPDIFVTADKRWLYLCKDIGYLGIELKIISYRKRNSTTSIVSKIIKRYCS